jgi:hypothetical protein
VSDGLLECRVDAELRSGDAIEIGFLPGEDVAVAVIVGYVTADGDGRVRTSTRLWGAPVQSAGTILFGTVSGTLVRGVTR